MTDLHKERVDMCKFIANTDFNDEIKEAIKGIFGVFLSSGKNDINLDFDDLKTILKDGRIAFVGSAEYEGKNSAKEAIKVAIQNTTLDFNLLDKVAGVLTHFEIHPSFSLMEIAEAMELINESANDEADIIWGMTTNNLVAENYVKVTILLVSRHEDV